MKSKIVWNILFSGLEKFTILLFQFLSSVLLINFLPREDYGVIGVVVGYFTFVNFFNVSLESIILRDHKKYEEKISEIMQDFFVFNLLKSLFFVFVASILSIVFTNIYKNSGFIYALWATTFITVAEMISAPYIIYFSSKFNQKLVTKLSIVRSLLGFLILLGLYKFPFLWFVALKEFIVSFLFAALWIFVAIKKLKLRIRIGKPNCEFLKDAFFSYSLWTHLNGAVTNFIYRSDTIFLSLFVGLSIVGDYNVALNSANVANILPMLLGYQNSIAISNATCKSQLFKISNSFLKVSILIGIVTLICFICFGSKYLLLLTGKAANDDIYFYMISIVTGLIIVKSFASPLNSYINIYGSVKKLFKEVLILSFFFTLISYYFSAKFGGPYGIALANIAISTFWLLLMIRQAKRENYDFSSLLNFDYELEMLKRVFRR